MKKIDLTNKIFGKWTVLNYAGNRKWLCKCECGTIKEVEGATLRGNRSKCCGCSKILHGYEGTKIYRLWLHMKERCFYPKHKSYKDYGGRGITVCDDWLNANDFIKWALANGYKEGLSIERKNYNGNYEPNNCVFVTMKEQANNRRNNRNITINGETKTLSQWANEYGIGPKTLRYRIETGWPQSEWFKSVGSVNNGKERR